MGISSSTQKAQIITHSRLGDVTLGSTVINQQNITTLIITKTLPNFQPVQNWLTYIREISPLYKMTKKQSNKIERQMKFIFKQPIQTLNLSSLFLPLSYSWKEQGYCGEGGTLKIEYECIMFDLQNEIINRREQGKYFLQTEMWFLLYNLLQLLVQFSAMKKRIGNLHPKNILIDEDGQIKMITKYSLLEQLDSYQQKLSDINCNAFLSPEQIQDLNRAQRQQFHDKAEIYSLGITILSTGTLFQGDQFYRIHLGSGELITIDQQLINQKLTSFRQHYSTFLSSLLQAILKVNSNERKSAAQIYGSLKQYQKDILDLHPFLPNNFIQQRKLNQSSKQNKLLFNSYLVYDQKIRSHIKKLS